jgi:hypothetical protein
MRTVANKILQDNGKDSYDGIMTDILRYVHDNFTYKSDLQKWKVPEKWEDITNVWQTRECDCESGSAVMYVLARLCGVPTNRLLMLCGNCANGKSQFGHCWLAYKSQEYPLNWCFMDWCTHYERLTPNSRTKYLILDRTIHDYANNDKYLELWFGFNEYNSYIGLLNKQ